ncbi:L,D-transpeptidase [Patescibacteria group bacterium]|nr:L,D-transpeptidase [Patescibacteria group bacterium]
MKRLFLALLIIPFFFLFSFKTDAVAQKRIEVDLTNQRLYAYDGNALVYNFPVSTGKSATPTPTGGFWPWIKLRFDRMIGPGYDLPNVPYVIYFYNANFPQSSGYSLHGTYWHNNFGYPMSHGCVNLSIPDAAKLYYWIDLPSNNNPGTIIIIKGLTPAS